MSEDRAELLVLGKTAKGQEGAIYEKFLSVALMFRDLLIGAKVLSEQATACALGTRNQKK